MLELKTERPLEIIPGGEKNVLGRRNCMDKDLEARAEGTVHAGNFKGC